MSRMIKTEDYNKLPSPTTEPMAWDDNFEFTFTTPREARLNCPFKAGDVILVGRGAAASEKAVVTRVCTINLDSEWTCFFRVATLTKEGQWSKSTVKAWPGYIELGYRKAISPTAIA